MAVCNSPVSGQVKIEAERFGEDDGLSVKAMVVAVQTLRADASAL
jgi:hypothetical protein